MHNLQQAIVMEKVTSAEHIVYPGRTPRPVLKDISLLVESGQVWGFSGPSLLEIKVLLEIMANIRLYAGGRCVLAERGMPRHKRVILNHVFYIGGSAMMYNNMNVLEFLMFVTAKIKTDKVELQDQIFEFLIKIGLGHISLSANRLLTREEKAVILLLAAVYTNSRIVVLNLPEYNFDESLAAAIGKIAERMSREGKTLIIGTRNCLVLEEACSHMGILAGGKFIYTGAVTNFRQNLDKVEVIIRDRNITAMTEILAPLLPRGHKLSVKGDSLLISRSDSSKDDPGAIFRKIIDSGWIPEHLEVNPKTVQNAYEELMRQYDLQG